MIRRFVYGAVLILLVALPASAQEVEGLAGWSLFLDPGHSQTENLGIYGYSEAEKVLRVGLFLQDLLLETTDIDTVYISRTSDSEQVSLSQRTDHANSVGAAWYHSIHSDAGAPELESTLMLWGQYQSGLEKIPNGGKQMSDFMLDLLTRSYRTTTRGSFGDCTFYGCSFFGPYLHVNRESTMPSELSEAGFHTNPTQNQRNMNADWKRVEAYAFYWSILEYHGLPRPAKRIVIGEVTDVETGRPINGAVVNLGDAAYTTDTYDSLFNLYSDDPDQLSNGFFYFEDVPAGLLDLDVTAEGFSSHVDQVETVDSFFTFVDVSLVNTTPPYLTRTIPEVGEESFKITSSLTFDFSRQMDRTTTEAAFSIEPDVSGALTWSNNDFTLTLNPDSLSPETGYTVTILGSAVGAFGDPFDGNGDGTGGDDFVLAFTTGPRDIEAPKLLTTYPAPNASGVAMDDLVKTTFDELLDPASIDPALFTLAPTVGGSEIAGTVQAYDVGEKTAIHFFPDEPLAPNTSYRLTIDEGLLDLVGNVASLKQFTFTTGDGEVTYTTIDDFDGAFAGDWWVPQQSGSTVGIVTDSTDMSQEVFVVNPLLGSSGAMRLDYGFDTGASSWLIREYLGGGAPRDVWFDDAYQLQAYIFGDESGTLFRFAVDDNVPAADAGNHEVSPWIAIDWAGWQRVTWNLPDGETGAWLGNGILNGTLRFDSFQLSYADGQPEFGTLFIDDLRLALVASPTSTESAELPETVVLLPNYPNPFNPSTTLRFALPAGAEVTVRVFNVLGAEVATLVRDTRYSAGVHKLRFEASGLPSGAYFARLEVEGRVLIQPMLLVK